MLRVSSISSGLYIDPEHQRIIQELLQLGITPSYNKSVDQAKLAKAKNELINKIQKREEENRKSSQPVQSYSAEDNDEYSLRAEMEERRLGAMTIAELNKFFLVTA